MSGGEQQMLAMGRALMSHPKIILMDEPSMGLSPIFVNEIFDIIKGGQRQRYNSASCRAECEKGAQYCGQSLCTGNRKDCAGG